MLDLRDSKCLTICRGRAVAMSGWWVLPWSLSTAEKGLVMLVELWVAPEEIVAAAHLCRQGWSLARLKPPVRR